LEYGLALLLEWIFEAITIRKNVSASNMKKLLPTLLGGIAIFLIFISRFGIDSYADEAASFIKADSQVQARVGHVDSLSGSNTIIVRAGDKTKAYREYQFIVRGSRGKALISVQMRDEDSPAKRYFSIKSIESL
jgi:hypothetical protein